MRGMTAGTGYPWKAGISLKHFTFTILHPQKGDLRGSQTSSGCQNTSNLPWSTSSDGMICRVAQQRNPTKQRLRWDLGGWLHHNSLAPPATWEKKSQSHAKQREERTYQTRCLKMPTAKYHCHCLVIQKAYGLAPFRTTFRIWSALVTCLAAPPSQKHLFMWCHFLRFSSILPDLDLADSLFWVHLWICDQKDPRCQAKTQNDNDLWQLGLTGCFTKEQRIQDGRVLSPSEQQPHQHVGARGMHSTQTHSLWIFHVSRVWHREWVPSLLPLS